MADEFPNFLACLGEFLAVLQIEDAVLGPGRLPRKAAWGAAVVYWLLTLELTRYFVPFTLGGILFHMVQYGICTLLFGGTIRRKLFTMMVFGGLLILYGDFMGLILAILFKKEFAEIWYSNLAGVFYGVMSSLLAFLLTRLIRRQLQETDAAQKVMSGSYLMVIILTSVVLAELSRISRQYTFLVFICMGFLLAAAIYMILFVVLNRNTQQARRAREAAQLEQARADALMASYQTQRKMTHEFTNHLDVMSSYLDQQDIQGAKDYLARLSDHVLDSTLVVNTHNPLMDSLLSREYHAAGEKNVQMSFDLCDLRSFPLQDAELATVMCNLLDNAICAAEGADPPQVMVRIRRSEQEFVVSVRNRMARPLEWNGKGLPPSTKGEPGHGMGLSNVFTVVERHRGEHTISCREGWFCVTFALPHSSS